jgi:hypothetical protein
MRRRPEGTVIGGNQLFAESLQSAGLELTEIHKDYPATLVPGYDRAKWRRSTSAAAGDGTRFDYALRKA